MLHEIVAAVLAILAVATLAAGPAAASQPTSTDLGGTWTRDALEMFCRETVPDDITETNFTCTLPSGTVLECQQLPGGHFDCRDTRFPVDPGRPVPDPWDRVGTWVSGSGMVFESRSTSPGASAGGYGQPVPAVGWA